MTNEFRTIPSLKNLYEINSDGTVVRRLDSGYILKPQLEGKYLKVNVCVDGVMKQKKIHSLVAECWLGERPEGLEVDHIDRNTFNNYYKNLRYATSREQRLNQDGKTNAPIQIILTKDDEKLYFDTAKDAALALNKFCPAKSFFTLRNSFKRRYNKILGFDVEYFRNGERLQSKPLDFTRQPKEITLKIAGESFRFDTRTNAAKALCDIYPKKTFSTFMNYMRKRKKKIFDFEVEYPAED